MSFALARTHMVCLAAFTAGLYAADRALIGIER